MNDRLAALRLFVRVARLGSFSRAALEAHMSQPSASRAIAGLEARLGVALFVRSTRAVRLTDAGTDYLARVEPLLASLADADVQARGDGTLRGLLRIALPTSFGSRELVPRLGPFLLSHPHLQLELIMADARQNLIMAGADIAFRLGVLDDSTMLARKLADAPRLLVASSAYVGQHGTPSTPGDLVAHRTIAGPADIGPTIWSFAKDGQRASIAPVSVIRINANEGAIAAATAGLGIAFSSLWGCRDELESGALIRLLPTWQGDAVPLYALFPGGRGAPRAARALADYVAANLGEGQ